MKKYILLAILIFSKASFAEPPSDNEAQAAMLKDYCTRSVGDVDVSKELFDAGLYADILLELNSKNIDLVEKHVGTELRFEVIFLYQQLKSNPCKASKVQLEKIYPMLRVIAAVSARIPIQDFERDAEIKKILDEAIKENPEHYKRLVERSKEWGTGIK